MLLIQSHTAAPASLEDPKLLQGRKLSSYQDHLHSKKLLHALRRCAAGVLKMVHDRPQATCFQEQSVEGLCMLNVHSKANGLAHSPLAIHAQPHSRLNLLSIILLLLLARQHAAAAAACAAVCKLCCLRSSC
jgi:hypothetical protein